ncbi:MAG TPA: hypothetical protein VFH56_04875, partial [Acidimicrobiales bacterium]|nr:hypothetical protein [Acidimicrobiales bacterium]
GSAVMRNNTATANSNGGAPTNEAVVTLPVKRFHLNSGDAVTLVAFTGIAGATVSATDTWLAVQRVG